MKYEKEYQEFMKKITDTFINKLTNNSAEQIEKWNLPKYKKINDKIIFYVNINENGDIYEYIDEAPHEMDSDIKNPKNVVEEWLKIKNECALKWLKKNAITYNKWITKYKETKLK